jgi:hypothetical protein
MSKDKNYNSNVARVIEKQNKIEVMKNDIILLEEKVQILRNDRI